MSCLNMRKKITVSLDDKEQDIFKFLKERISESEDSKASKLAYDLVHEYLDMVSDLKAPVGQRLLEVIFYRMKFGYKPYTQKFQDWLKEYKPKSDEFL